MCKHFLTPGQFFFGLRFIYSMEGFVNTNTNSPFEYGLKHSSLYANYGVDKAYIKREHNSETKPLNLEQNPEAYQALLGKNALSGIDKTVVDTVTIEDKNKKQRFNAALAVGGSVIGLGAVTLAVTKGRIPKAMTNAMGKLIDNITKKTEELKQKPSMSRMQGYYLSGLQKVKHGAFMIRGAIFNLSPLKDVLFDKLLRQKCGLQKPCDAVTNWFKDLSFATVKSSYRKASQNIDSMTNVFRDVNTKLAAGEYGTIPDKSILKQIENKTANIRSTFDSSFAEPQLKERSDELVKTFDGLGNRVYNKIYGNMKGFIKDVNAWTSFVPEELVAKDKAGIMNSLAEHKKVITNNPSDNYKNLLNVLSEMEGSINPNDKSSRNILRSLRDLAKQYAGLSGPTETEMRKKIMEEINSVLKNARNISESDVYNPKESKKLISLIREYGKIVNTDKKGDIEEILTLYKDILPPEVYAKVKKSAMKTVKSLNQAVHNEGFEYVDKVRDLSTGSALTDVALGMAVPAVSTGVALSVADTKEKKRSVVLKYGLPLFIGIGTTTLCTVKLISGGKSLILGTLSGMLANDICERIDNKLKDKSNPAKEDNNTKNTKTL